MQNPCDSLPNLRIGFEAIISSETIPGGDSCLMARCCSPDPVFNTVGENSFLIDRH